MMHFGHANAMRQGRMLGYELAGGPPTDNERERFSRCELYVGVHTDEEVELFKGCRPCMTAEERYVAVRAVKWVSHVVEDAPYVTDLADVERYDIDFVVHGDDLSVDRDGNDSYAAVKKAGKMKLVKRTEGVSTTDIITRMLLATQLLREAESVSVATIPRPPSEISGFVMTSRKLALFSSGRQPTSTDTVVYVDGGFDLFHLGHVQLLRKARELGTFVVVGVHSDAAVAACKGVGFPIMNVFERSLSVLACRYVDEVVMGVGSVVSKEVLDSMKVSVVVRGEFSVGVPEGAYAVPDERGIVTVVDSGTKLMTSDVRSCACDGCVAVTVVCCYG